MDKDIAGISGRPGAQFSARHLSMAARRCAARKGLATVSSFEYINMAWTKVLNADDDAPEMPVLKIYSKSGLKSVEVTNWDLFWDGQDVDGVKPARVV